MIIDKEDLNVLNSIDEKICLLINDIKNCHIDRIKNIYHEEPCYICKMNSIDNLNYILQIIYEIKRGKDES